jgi:hypothetical protein
MTSIEESSSKKINPALSRPWGWLVVAAALALLSLALAWISSSFQGVGGWGSFLVVLVLAAGLLWAGWASLRREALPNWLALALVGAAVLRLAAGALWMIVLPVAGYQSEAELGGYVMADAFTRDQAAWELSQSSKPLIKAFEGYRTADQYGGMLYLNALLYRYLGAENHQPLLMVVLTAAFSALAVIFTWAFARRAWNMRTAGLAAWGLALYPEAVLLGSSQMREAFTITLVMVAFYGLLSYWQDSGWKSLALVAGALAISLPFSPPAAALLMVFLAGLAIALGGWQTTARQRMLLLVVVLLLVAILAAGLWLTWGRIAPEKISNPLELVGWWLKKSAEWQAHLSESASGWMQKVFDSTPQGAHFPLLLAYGVIRPFLPAAIGDTAGAAVWRAIAIWRSLGWALLLPLLVLAPIQILRDKTFGVLNKRSMLMLALIVWAGILIASFRAGADPWDNPRYRATFAGLQIGLAAWVVMQPRRAQDPWLRRGLVSIALIMAWFLPWYLRRYTPLDWPVVNVFKTLGLGIASAALYVLWDWVRVQNPLQRHANAQQP